MRGAAHGMTLLIVVLIIAIAMVGHIKTRLTAPGPLTSEIEVVIRSGSTLTEIANTLEAAGAVESSTLFRLAARLEKQGQNLKAGEYRIPAGASLREIVTLLAEGRGVQHRITLAEGLTVREIVTLLEQEPLLVGTITRVPSEGSIAPDTYFFERGESRQAVLDRMVTAQSRLLAAAWAARKPGLPLKTPQEALILASIVEKETGVASERARVAGVFINRLNKKMRLQSDPTIVYGLTLGQRPLGRELTRKDIQSQTPYNTYVIDGLPPGPIANPGKAAIEAVLNPMVTKELYFVADGTGGHAFAETLEEHNANVARWRKLNAD